MIEAVHTYAPITGEVMRRDEIAAPATIHSYLADHEIQFFGPVLALRVFQDADPAPIMRARWDDPISDGERLCFVHLPQGGGGGGSNPGQLIATIALVTMAVAAPHMAPAAWGLATASGTTFAGAMVTTGIMALGSALLQPLFAQSLGRDSETSSGSGNQMHSIATGGSIPAIDSIVPVPFGKNTWHPPRASHDWVEFVEDHPQKPADQYANVLLVLGPGTYDLHKVEIGGTNIANLEGVTSQLVPPGGTITLAGYHDNIFTSPLVNGAELPKYGRRYWEGVLYSGIYPATAIYNHEFESSPTYDGYCYIMTHRYSPDGEDRIYPWDDFMPGDQVTLSWDGGACNLTVKYRLVSGPDGIDNFYTDEILMFEQRAWPVQPPNYATMTVTEYVAEDRLYVGPYAASKSGQAVDRISVDLVHPGGLYYAEDDGSQGFLNVTYQVDIQALSATGSPVGGWSVLGTISYEERTISPLRRTHHFNVAAGYYQVRMSRPIETANNRKIDRVQWVGLKGRLPAKMTYSKVTTLAMRIKAGTYLSSSALSDIMVQATRKLPTYNGSAWTAPVATRSIAWAMGDLCRNDDWSIGLSDDQADAATMTAYDATWAARGDTCDGILRTATTFWGALEQIARTGRAIPQVPGGIVTVMRDQPQSVVRAVFTVRNIKRGSFSMDDVQFTDDTPDDLLTKYIDAETGEQAEPVLCSLPDSDGESPVDFSLWGVGNQAQALREGLYEAACNQYRRRFVSFTAVNYAGRVLRRGHLISVSHPLPDWGVSGDVMAVDGRTLKLSEPVTFAETGDHFISLVKGNGTPDGPYRVTAGADEFHVTLADADPPEWISTDGNKNRTAYQFGPDDNYGTHCIVVSATPRGTKGEVAIVAMEDDARVYTADGGA